MYNSMYMAARVRFFCVPGPKGDPAGDISYRYLSAFHRSGMGVRAIPLGGIDLASISGREGGGGRDDPWGHWERLAECFVEPVSAGYVNVVCCPPGTIYGVNKTAKTLAPGMSDSDEVVTSAGLAICELLTSSVSNVLITGTSQRPTFDELVAMGRYRKVIVHEKEDVEKLVSQGVSAFFLTPNDLMATFPLFLKDEALTA